MISVMHKAVIWPTAPAKVDLSATDVHVWLAKLDREPDVLERLESTLAPDEKSRAARFIARRDRDRFISARGILRGLLAVYVNRPPSALEFHYGPFGKPALHTESPDLPIRFNLSHSHGLALYAFALRRDVGVDLELVQTDFGGEEVAERFFSARELAELRTLPPDLRAEGFFNCWTRKEAYVKARGNGLQIQLDSFDVSLTPGYPDALNSPDCSRWSLCSFQPAPQFVAAVVAEGRGWRLRYLEWGLPAPPTAPTASPPARQ